MMKNAVYSVFVDDNWATASIEEDHRLWLNVSEPLFFLKVKNKPAASINVYPGNKFWH